MEGEYILHITGIAPMMPMLYMLIICHFIGGDVRLHVTRPLLILRNPLYWGEDLVPSKT